MEFADKEHIFAILGGGYMLKPTNPSPPYLQRVQPACQERLFLFLFLNLLGYACTGSNPVVDAFLLF